MNFNKPFAGRRHQIYQAVLLLLATPLLSSRVTGGQSIIANPGGTVPDLMPSAVQEDEANNEMNVFVPVGSATDNTLPQPFQFGQVTLRPHVSYSFNYGNGIQNSPTNQQTTAIQQISAGLAADLGRHWSVDYTPTARFYSNNQFKDGVDHAVSLVGGTHYEDWMFGLSQSFLYSTAPTAETGTQTEQENFATALTASHSLGEKMSLDMGLNQTLAYADNLQNSRDWSTLDWLNYHFGPRLTAGVGAGAGYVSVDIGPDQTFEQLQARLNWRATDKVSFQLSGGGEDRQYLSGRQSDMLTPTFNVAIQYQPFRDTQISANAGRSVSPSIIPGSDSTVTSFGVNINQALFKKFSLSLGASYNISKLTELLEKDQIILGIFRIPSYYLQDRTDDNYSFNLRLSHPLLRRGTISVFYTYSDNQSTEKAFTYQSNQVGFEIGYRY